MRMQIWDIRNVFKMDTRQGFNFTLCVTCSRFESFMGRSTLRFILNKIKTKCLVASMQSDWNILVTGILVPWNAW